MNTTDDHVAVSPAPARGSAARWLWILAAVAAVGGVGYWVKRSTSTSNAGGPGAAPSGSADAGARPVPVAASLAVKRDVPIYLDGLGNAVPLQTVTVHTLVDGRLDRCLLHRGAGRSQR